MVRRSTPHAAYASARTPLQQQRSLLNLLSATAATANQATSTDDALQQALDQIAQHTGWPVSHVYLPTDTMQDELASSRIWHLDSPQRFDHFRRTTDVTRFRPGLGLVGQVQATARPIWAPDVTTDHRFIRRRDDLDLGVRAGVLFPILVGAEVAGVLECYTSDVVAPDPSLLEVLANVGVVLGRVVERARMRNKVEQHLTLAAAAQLQTARRDAAGELATTIAHEINNPLYAARNALELIRQDLSQAESPFIEILHDELARIADVTQRMRSFAPPSRGRLAPVDLYALLDGALAESKVALRRPPIRVQIAINSAGSLPQLRCDHLQIQQALGQVMANGADAMPEGGALSIHADVDYDRVVITISDTGAGIPPDAAPYIFEPFFTTRPGRSGLGLATSAQIIAQHGGSISAHTGEHGGAVFRMTLPFAPPETAPY